MKKTVALLSMASLACAQAGVAFATSDSPRAEVKAPAPICSAAKLTKNRKKVQVANVCQGDAPNRTAGYVFAGAAVAGVVAIAVSTTDHHHITASP